MNAQILSLISLVLNLLLGGGLLVNLLRHREKMRDVDRVDFETISEALQKQRNEAWERIAEQDKKIELLEAEINGLRLARDLDPFPNWVVDLHGRYRFVNREFEAYFLEPKGQTYRDIVGKSHEDVWPPEFCQTLRTLDASARQRPDGTARTVTNVDIPNMGLTQVTIHKFPIRFKGGIVAYAGYITSLEPKSQMIGIPTPS